MIRSWAPRALLLLAVIWQSPALGAAAQNPASLAPSGWDAQAKLPEAVDRNPDPHIVEINMVARVADVEIAPGKHVKAWTYDGGLPGPLIRVHVGDRLIVHLTNELPQPTTIHWHGVRVPIEMDGVPDISQPEIKTGESFTYDFLARDAGLYWYHPHVQSAAQVGFGLYGALLVEDPAEATTVGVPDEVTLVLSDIGFDDDGTLDDPDNGDSTGMVFGREGTYVLVNGRRQPTLLARSGAPQRWRVVNAAKSRFFVLNMDGFAFTVIGGDGGLQESSITTEQVLVTPGERVDLIVTPTGAPGTELIVRSMLHNRGYGSFFRNVEDILTVRISDDPPAPRIMLPKVTRTITPPPIAGATRVPMTVTLPPIDWKGHNEFQINGVPSWKATPYLAKVGETQIWVVKNDTDWDHPFHLHGFFFIPLDEHDQPIHPMGWKDTVNIPQRTTARLLVQFDERPGTWMFHCHILDHAEGGMMGHVQVGPVAAEHMHMEEPKPFPLRAR